jgi:hypothetical protein
VTCCADRTLTTRYNSVSADGASPISAAAKPVNKVFIEPTLARLVNTPLGGTSTMKLSESAVAGAPGDFVAREKTSVVGSALAPTKVLPSTSKW